ncbi:MAG: SDR family oxidoreductase [Alphaproteobacteria bacterium]|nr:SDR family oxidoreductase [Alphaproteobacteria bacterium]
MRLALTGGATGIGAATAARLRADGHEVVIFDIRDPDSGDRWIQLDLMDPGSIAAALQAADGSFDGLCSIAGVPPRDDNAVPCLTVNTLATCAFIEGFMPKLNEGAAVVSVASRAGMGWQSNLDQLENLLAQTPASLDEWCAGNEVDATKAYILSKQALIYWHQRAVTPYIGKHRFVTVSPSAVSTGILDDFVKAFGPMVAANLARVGRSGTPQEVAELIAFCVSPAASWMNGVDVITDGGMGAMAMMAQRNGE